MGSDMLTQVYGADVPYVSVMTISGWLGYISLTDWGFCCCWRNSKFQGTQMFSKRKVSINSRPMVLKRQKWKWLQSTQPYQSGSNELHALLMPDAGWCGVTIQLFPTVAMCLSGSPLSHILIQYVRGVLWIVSVVQKAWHFLSGVTLFSIVFGGCLS